MQNNYTVVGNKAYIQIAATGGKKPLPQGSLILDVRNLNKARVYPGTWSQSIHQHTGNIYIRGNHSSKRDGQPVFARYITNAGKQENTRHIDGNPFNCLECNLVNVRHGVRSIEGLEPVGPPPTPEVVEKIDDVKPTRGVSWHKTKKRWEVKPTYEGKRILLGYWHEDQLNEANEAIKFFRENGPEAYATKYGEKRTV